MIKQDKLLLLLLTLFLTNLYAQESINQFDNDGERNGIWKKNFENTKQIKYEGNFEHGKEVGLFKFYKLVNGKSALSATREFDANSDDILVKFYASSGKLISEGHMRDKIFVGKWVYYHNRTKGIMTLEHYNDQGQLDGERNVFYANGQMAEQTFYVNGKIEGVSKIFSERGVLIKAFLYSDNMLNGISKYYNGDGQLLAEGAYRNDQQHGIWKYYENGVLKEEKDFTVYSKNPKKQ